MLSLMCMGSHPAALPRAYAALGRAAGARLPDEASLRPTSRGAWGWRPKGGVLRPTAGAWGGMKAPDQATEKDSIGKAGTRCGRPSQHMSHGCPAAPAQVATAEPP